MSVSRDEMMDAGLVALISLPAYLITVTSFPANFFGLGKQIGGLLYCFLPTFILLLGTLLVKQLQGTAHIIAQFSVVGLLYAGAIYSMFWKPQVNYREYISAALQGRPVDRKKFLPDRETVEAE